MTQLLKEGMNNAISAGGLEAMLHADYLHAKYDAASIRSTSPSRISGTY